MTWHPIQAQVQVTVWTHPTQTAPAVVWLKRLAIGIEFPFKEAHITPRTAQILARMSTFHNTGLTAAGNSSFLLQGYTHKILQQKLYQEEVLRRIPSLLTHKTQQIPKDLFNQ